MPKAKSKKQVLYAKIYNKDFLKREAKKLKLTLTEYVQQLVCEQMTRVEKSRKVKK